LTTAVGLAGDLHLDHRTVQVAVDRPPAVLTGRTTADLSNFFVMI
jgi:hypothetical protein